MPPAPPAYELLTGIACGGEVGVATIRFSGCRVRGQLTFSPLPRQMLITAPPERAVYSQVREVTMFHMSSLLKSAVLTAAVCFAAASAMAQPGKPPTDPQIADIAYTAGQIDIEQAIDALKRAENKAVISFAEEMVRDHLAVNDKVLVLLRKLKVRMAGNDTSKTMYQEARLKREELRALSDTAFDKAYAENEVAYHEAVIGALESVLIPSAQNEQLKSLLETGVKIFKEHKKHAEKLVDELK
jgi:putative membrane protein